MQTRPLQALEASGALRELTSLRFFAAMWVVLLHFGFELKGGTGVLAPFVGRGDLAVDLFFILSGFILAQVYFADYARDRFSWPRYLLYRIGRIYPLHLFTLALAVLIAVAAQQLAVTPDAALPWRDLPSHLLMVHGWGVTDRTAWNDPSWSISAEFFAYLATPAFFAIAYALRRRPLVLVAVAVLAFVVTDAGSAALLGKPATLLNADFGIVRIAPEFLLGVALSRLSGVVRLRYRAAGWLAAAALGAGLAALYMSWPDAVVVLAQAALIFALAQRGMRPEPSVLRSRPLVYLGEISYAIYLVHALVDRVFFTLLERAFYDGERLPLLPWLLAFPILLAAAALLHRTIELPGRALVRGWADRRFPKKAAVATQAG